MERVDHSIGLEEVIEANGFREFDHTADWGIKVWAADLVGLLETAAKGMFSLLEVQRGSENHIQFTFALDKSQDPEDLLVEFLRELLFLSEKHRVAFYSFEFKPAAGSFDVVVKGFPIASQKKEIKAVTYYNLAVVETERGLEAEIVFDA